MSESYTQLLRDPRWQRTRLAVFERDNFTCFYCASTEKTLNVHHTYYVSGRAPWEYPLLSFETVCEECHERIRKNPSPPLIERLALAMTGGDKDSAIVLEMVLNDLKHAVPADRLAMHVRMAASAAAAT